ncbi:hypothetical protein AA313_de0204526 [Arthrobotrys entomopaga]|nr:hypothetical protein AA313_de0204526 [Arthrobotrys entomopaga]
MNSLFQLKETLRRRRQHGQHLTSDLASQKLDLLEVWNTRITENLRKDHKELTLHIRDIEYIEKWFLVYAAFRESDMVPGRVFLLGLVNNLLCDMNRENFN